ncbi:MAG: hypothetical protein OHK93_002465 [Ramalina farinacea]|uniref:Exonuclease domain-containing protein n=1 Tax=Ramalina farinacea TaxID=258253 RepID=A0AA43QS94_9LECA|nr:hypothetical protein [Ramalina farinacea]
MGSRNNKKRKRGRAHSRAHSEETDNNINAALAQLRGEPLPVLKRTLAKEEASPKKEQDDVEKGSDSGEWQTVKAKKQKKHDRKYPGLGYSELHRLHDYVKLHDLQNLLLYCIADAPGPQFVHVRHRNMVERAVVLFVPGLEKGMFDGSISLQEPPEDDDAKDKFASSPFDIFAKKESDVLRKFPHIVTNNARSNGRPMQARPKHPDEYMPLKLKSDNLADELKPLADIFDRMWPVRAPGDDRMKQVHSPLQAMLQSQIPRSREGKDMEKKDKGQKSSRNRPEIPNQRTSIVVSLARGDVLRDNEYVLHPASWAEAGLDSEQERARRLREKQTESDGWFDTDVSSLEAGMPPEDDIQKGSITAGRQLLSLDCEMCTVQGGSSALTRISLVDWAGNTVLDELVKPALPIIDYLTPYSGITRALLAPVTTTLRDIQERLLKSILTPYTILVGHSLDSDLTALQITHPFIIDTSILFPHPRGPPIKSSLKYLANKYLNREIQKGHGSTGHNSIEDALACLDLVKLKCEKGPKFGAQDGNLESIFKRMKRSINQIGGKEVFKGAIVDHGNAGDKNFGAMADVYIPCADDAEVVESIKRLVSADDNERDVPGGGTLQFTWARLRELEYARGWRDDSVATPLAPAPTPALEDAMDTPTSHDNITTSSAASQPNTPASTSNTSTQTALTNLISHITSIHASLPPCTLLMIYSGTGDPRPMARLQHQHDRFRRLYKKEGKKWDELAPEDRWTDYEEQALKFAVEKARGGCGLMCIK